MVILVSSSQVKMRRNAACMAFVLIQALAVAGDTPRTADQIPVDDEEFLVAVDPHAEKKIAGFVEQLGSTSFSERENATRALTEYNARAFPKLREAYRNTTDFEVRSRIERIVRKSFIEYHVYAQFGYLGISLGGTPGPEENPLIPAGRVGIQVGNINPNTGAERGGLKPNDIIIAVNGEPISGVGQRAMDGFREGIRDAGPGAELEFHVVRGNSELSVVVTLTRPPELGRDGQAFNIQALPIAMASAEARYPAWWVKHFANSDRQSQE